MNHSPVFGFDTVDPYCVAGLTCHIELDMSGAKTPREAATQVARQLRATADLIEAGALDTGFHSLPVGGAEAVGEVYLDFYGEDLP